MKKKPTIALMYDFDKTLADQDMQNYTFIPNLDMSPEELSECLGVPAHVGHNDGAQFIRDVLGV